MNWNDSASPPAVRRLRPVYCGACGAWLCNSRTPAADDGTEVRCRSCGRTGTVRAFFLARLEELSLRPPRRRGRRRA